MVELTGDDFQALNAHLGEAKTADEWSRQLAESYQTYGPIAGAWEVAASDELRHLETWVAVLEMFDRRLAVAAGVAAVEHVLPLFEGSSSAADADLRTLLESISSGNTSAPRIQVAAARAWLVAPSDTLADAADATLEESEPPDLALPEYAELTSRPWIWVVEGAADVASAPAHPEAGRMASRAAVAALRALQASGATDEQVSALLAAIRAQVRAEACART